MARNRYGWQKRAKELARKEKSDEKMNRRQGKAASPSSQEIPVVIAEETFRPDETASAEEDPAGLFRQGQD